MSLLGLEAGADQSTLGEWLRAQTKESVIALHRINAEFVDWSIQEDGDLMWRHAYEVCQSPLETSPQTGGTWLIHEMRKWLPDR